MPNDMDLQDVIDNEIKVQRGEQMKDSEQLVLGELILKLEAVDGQRKPVVFDDGVYHPTSLGSWRGSYRELAIRWESEGEPMTTSEFLERLRDAIGSSFTGYKGGEFTMGKTTPVWVANYGESSGFAHSDQGAVNVSERKDAVAVVTDETPYM